MHSKNHRPLTPRERSHVERVKRLPCGVCGAEGQSEAHHVVQERHWTVIPLCEDCHRGSFNGWHGQRRIWQVKKLDEMDVLNATIEAIYG
jgi:hypothetical protein